MKSDLASSLALSKRAAVEVMKHGRFKETVLVTMGILVVGFIGLSGCIESAGSSFVVPTFEEPGPPPIEVTIDQLYAEFIADEAAAKAKYKGEKLLFTGVTVEEIDSYFLDIRATKIYIRSGPAEFLPRYPDDFDYILEGFVVDIVGDCQGLSWGRVVINDCWIQVTEGDIGDVVADVY